MTHGNAGKVNAQGLPGARCSWKACGRQYHRSGNLWGHLGDPVANARSSADLSLSLPDTLDLDGIDDVLQVTVELLFEVGI